MARLHAQPGLLLFALLLAIGAAGTPAAARIEPLASQPIPPPVGFLCTQIVGFSQNREWFVEAPDFESVVEDARWQLVWESGASIDRWADPSYGGWSSQPVSPCAENSQTPDRIILTITGEFQSDPLLWVDAIQDAVAAARARYPAVRQILLQPVVGGPGHALCTFDGAVVRASSNHPVIDEAIVRVVAGDASGIVAAGFSPQVRSCADYRDAKGHLGEAARGPIGRAIGEYYAALDLAVTATPAASQPTPTAPLPTATASLRPASTSTPPRPTTPPGGPWAMHVIDDISEGADGARYLDVNGDGWPDVAAGYEQGGITRACLHPGPAKVRDRWPCVTVGQTPNVEGAVFADVDQDGAYDVISASEGGADRIQIHWGPADPARYLDASAWKTDILPASVGRASWFDATPLQIDGRNGMDFFGHGSGDSGQLVWFQSPPNPREMNAWTLNYLRAAGGIPQIHTVDVDGDGDLDAIVSERRDLHPNTAYWVENPGAGDPAQTRPWPVHDIGGGTHELVYTGVGDLDQDGLLDYVAAAQVPNAVLLFRKLTPDGSAWRQHEVAWPANAGVGKGANIGDIDLDGRMDIVISAASAQGAERGVLWLSYVQSVFDPVWQEHEINGDQGTKFDRVELLDLDGDGDLDVSTTEEIDNLGIVWWENPYGGPATPTPGPSPTPTATPPSGDHSAPQVTGFQVQSPSVQGAAAINFVVQDAGGSHLQRVGLLRAADRNGQPDPQTWVELTRLRQIFPDPRDQASGLITNFPPPGASWYSLYAADGAGNIGFAAAPLRVDNPQRPEVASVFRDVPVEHWAFADVESLFAAGYTMGCDALGQQYCPSAALTRAEIAVFLQRALHGAQFLPPDPVSPHFQDTSPSDWFTNWVEGIWRDGLSAGCSAFPPRYCPLDVHPREEGAVFALRMLYGQDYRPPAARGLFSDLSAGGWSQPWVEAAFAAGLLAPCRPGPDPQICPQLALSRAMAAAMVVRAKGLP